MSKGRIMSNFIRTHGSFGLIHQIQKKDETDEVKPVEKTQKTKNFKNNERGSFVDVYA